MNPKLTPHQRWALERLTWMGQHDGRWVPLKYLGSPGAYNRLVGKGYVEERVERGPRGGYHKFYRILSL